jgi:dihydrolipoamide dehydrogenase
MGRRCKVAIVGVGTAGLSALAVVRGQTEDFVIINDGPYGTTCARVGCMPSKALIEVAKGFHHRNAFANMGITGAEHLGVDVPAVLRRVRRLRDGFVQGVLRLTDGLGSRNIAGRARLLGPSAVEVNGERIEAERIIIASGSRPIVPKEWTALGDRLLTTDDLFEQADLPRRLAVIGLGAIGAEMAKETRKRSPPDRLRDARTSSPMSRSITWSDRSDAAPRTSLYRAGHSPAFAGCR